MTPAQRANYLRCAWTHYGRQCLTLGTITDSTHHETGKATWFCRWHFFNKGEAAAFNQERFAEEKPFGPNVERDWYLVNGEQPPAQFLPRHEVKVTYRGARHNARRLMHECKTLMERRLSRELDGTQFALALQDLDKKYLGIGFDKAFVEILQKELEEDDKREAEKKQKEKHESANEPDANVHVTA